MSFLNIQGESMQLYAGISFDISRKTTTTTTMLKDCTTIVCAIQLQTEESNILLLSSRIVDNKFN